MRIARSFIIVTLSLLSLSVSAKTKVKPEVSMSNDALMDKIRGAWAGQIIGCTYGGPTEFKYATIINDEVDIKWGEHQCKWYFDHSPGLYDDVYMDLTFVDVFARKGLDAPVEEFAEAFSHAGYSLWHANMAARYNLQHGIKAPASGYWENNPHADDIDFQIEADYAGIMSPGMPQAATHFSDDIGHIMNYGDGWYGGVYVANMYALAFVSDDMQFVVTEALKSIPEQSRFYKCMADVLKWYRQYPDTWELTWAMVNKHYAFDIGCPEGVYAMYDIDAVLNSAYILIGLLYGDKDFYRTIDISTRCGADSDCNPASAAGILGTMIGYGQIPEYWKSPLYEVADRPFKYTDISFNKACELSLDQARQVIVRYGGKVSDDSVTIRTQAPQTVRYEECFTGHWPVSKNDVKKSIGSMSEIKFDGNGIVFRYNWAKASTFKPAPGFEAAVEVYLDGEYSETVLLPLGGNCRKDELYFKYKLPVAPHTVSFKWTNKPSGLDIIVSQYIVYTDHKVKSDHCCK